MGVGCSRNRRNLSSAMVKLGGGSAVNPLLANLIFQAKLNEASGAALDSIGSRSLTALNSPGAAAGLINGCRTFDGTSGFGATSDDTISGVGIDFTASCWYWLASAGGTYDIFTSRVLASGNLCWLLRNDSGVGTVLYIGNGSGSFTTNTLTPAITGAWTHIIWNFVNATKAIRARVNGGSVQVLSSGFAPTTSASHKLGIGNEGDAGEAMPSGSKMDVCKFWAGVALSDSLMLSDYNAGAGAEL